MRLIKKIAVMALVLALSAALLQGCSGGGNRDGRPAAGNQQEQTNTGGGEQVKTPDVKTESEVAEEFEKLASENAIEPGKLLDYISKNISGLSKETASKMVLKLEEIQKAYLAELEEKFYSDEIGDKMADVFLKDFSLMNRPDQIEDADVKALISEAIGGGYKIDTAEGMFFPILDYERYKDFVSYVEDDIAAYIDIMATESGKMPAKDAALVIGWDDVAERALAQEKFISSFPQSVKIKEAENLYDNYRIYTFYGLNNTPLFDYKTKKMNEKAKEAYLSVLSGGIKDNSNYLKQLGEFMDLLKESGYKLTPDIDYHRNEFFDIDKLKNYSQFINKLITIGC